MFAFILCQAFCSHWFNNVSTVSFLGRIYLSQISALKSPFKCEINQLTLDQSVSEKRGHACPPETIGLLFTNGHLVVFVTVSYRIPFMEFANCNRGSDVL